MKTNPTINRPSNISEEVTGHSVLSEQHSLTESDKPDTVNFWTLKLEFIKLKWKKISEDTYRNSFLCGSKMFRIFSAYSFFAHV